jgi:hypothetical protein
VNLLNGLLLDLFAAVVLAAGLTPVFLVGYLALKRYYEALTR